MKKLKELRKEISEELATVSIKFNYYAGAFKNDKDFNILEITDIRRRIDDIFFLAQEYDIRKKIKESNK